MIGWTLYLERSEDLIVLWLISVVFHDEPWDKEQKHTYHTMPCGHGVCENGINSTITRMDNEILINLVIQTLVNSPGKKPKKFKI